MSLDSPLAIIYNSDGYEVSIKSGTAITANNSSLLISGSDGSNNRFITVDASGRVILVGAGSAGTPSGGVLSVQGVSGGQAIPISGTVTANNSSVGTNNSTVPSSSTLIGGSDGANLQSIRVFDADTGAGTQYVLGVNLRKSASGGSVDFGTSTDPIRIDPTGTTTQPISGTITVTQATPSSLLASVGGLGTSGSAIVGSPVRIGGSDGTNTRDILTDSSGRQIIVGAASSGSAVTGNPVLIAGSDGTNARTLSTDNTGKLQVVSTSSKPTTGTSSNVSSSTTNVTLLSSNSNRLGAAIYNDSNKKLYLKLGATSSLTSFTVIISAQGYYEVPFDYTGIIDGLWESVNGSARITELT